jgi:hypothetical protein
MDVTLNTFFKKALRVTLFVLYKHIQESIGGILVHLTLLLCIQDPLFLY